MPSPQPKKPSSGDVARYADMFSAMGTGPHLRIMRLLHKEVRVTAGLALDGLPQHEVAIRGRAEPMIVRAVSDAKTLSALVGEVDVVAA